MHPMSIRRAPRPDSDFLVLHNRISRDTRLSYRARGVLIEILSRPDNWSVSAERLAELSPNEGRDAIRTALNELVDAGYAKRIKTQDDGGRWRTETVVTEQPETDFQASVPETDEPTSVDPSPIEEPREEEPIQPLTTFGVAIASETADPPWVRSAAAFPFAERGTTDNGYRSDGSGWEPHPTIAHRWKHPEHGSRDLLWEATCQVFGMESPNDTERGRINKALQLYRQSGVDPAELPTLHRVYRMKMSNAPDTPLGLAGNIANCRRWANDMQTIDPQSARRTAGREMQDRAMLRLLEAGPGEEDPNSARAIGRRKARGQA